jgi:hypothetical protein
VTIEGGESFDVTMVAYDEDEVGAAAGTPGTNTFDLSQKIPKKAVVALIDDGVVVHSRFMENRI